MSVGISQSRVKIEDLKIDYVSLFRSWKKWTIDAVDQLNDGFFDCDEIPNFLDGYLTQKENKSMYFIYQKLTDAQKALLKTNFFPDLRAKAYSIKTNRKMLLELQVQLEMKIIKSANEFEYGQCPGKEERIAMGVAQIPVWNSEKFEYYDEYDVPERISGWKSFKQAVKRGNTICFYTGEMLTVTTTSSLPWVFSIEHLLPSSRGGTLNNGNAVPAAQWINQQLKNAPIHVKLILKEELDKVVCHPSVSMKDRRKLIYGPIVERVLNSFRIFNKFPWDYPPSKCKMVKRTLKKAYKMHLELEKELIDSGLGKSSNIEEAFMEMKNGMENPDYESV